MSNLKCQIQGLLQGSKTCTAYLQDAKNWANQLDAIGRPIDDEDLISFFFSGLNPTFNSFVTTFFMTTTDKSLTSTEFQDQLLSHETLINQQQAIVNEASNFAFFTQHQGGPSKQNFHSFNRKPKNGQYSKFSPRPTTGFPHHASQRNSAYQQQLSGPNGSPFQPTTRMPS